jgi:hypothetical protein
MIKHRITYLFPILALLLLLLPAKFVSAQHQTPSVSDTALVVTDTSVYEASDENSESNNTNEAIRYPDTVYIRYIPSSVTDSLKKLKKFAYANDPAYWKDEPVEANKGFWFWLAKMARKTWVKALFWILLIGFLLFIIIKIGIQNNFFLFYSSVKKNSVSDEIAESELMSEDINIHIREAEQQGRYREATRFHFLRVLQQLNKLHYISYDPQLTNSDYIRQLKDFHSLANFRTLTHIYDYVWYGEFEPSEQQYSTISKTFSEFYQVI